MTLSSNVRAAVYGAGSGAAALLFIGVPTVLIPNALFSRSIPARRQDYVVLGIATLLVGAIGATYAFPAACPLQEGKVTAGSLLSFLAVGCPVCNKIAVLALGASGAVTYFAPVQPLLAIGSVAVLGWALISRLRAMRPPRKTALLGDSVPVTP